MAGVVCVSLSGATRMMSARVNSVQGRATRRVVAASRSVNGVASCSLNGAADLSKKLGPARGLGLGLPMRGLTRKPSARKSSVPAQAFFTEFVQGIFGPSALDGFVPSLPGLLDSVKALPAVGMETVADAAMGVVAIFGAGAFIAGPDPQTESGGDGGGDDGRGRGKGGGGGDDNYDKWYFEDPEGEAHNFFIRGGVAGFYWILLCGALAGYCFLIGKSPHWGAMWCVLALGVGWGFFLVAGVAALGLVAAFFGIDYILNFSEGRLRENTQMVIGEMGEMVRPHFDDSAPAADKRAVSANANDITKLPPGIQVMGTDAQLVQVSLKAGEELSAEPGSMCYSSANVRSITTLKGGFLAGISRLIAGEPFFLNTFKNVSSTGKEGYIALAGKREGDKVIVLDMDELGGEFLCARDSYLCSTGEVDINAATTLMRGQMGLRLLLSNKNTVFMQKLTGSGIACITGNGTVIRQELKEGQEMVVDARAVVGFSKDIGYQLRMMSSAIAVLFGGEGLFFARLSGPGTFYLQSLPAARQEGNLSDEGEVAV